MALILTVIFIFFSLHSCFYSKRVRHWMASCVLMCRKETTHPLAILSHNYSLVIFTWWNIIYAHYMVPIVALVTFDPVNELGAILSLWWIIVSSFCTVVCGTGSITVTLSSICWISSRRSAFFQLKPSLQSLQWLNIHYGYGHSL